MSRARAAGFTLLEMMVVLGILAVLFGMGVGMLQRGSTDVDLALAIVRDQVRVAANTARSRGLPTEVQLIAGDQGAGARLQVRGLAPVAVWHFEPGERYGDRRLRPELSGHDEPSGRFGHGRRPDPASEYPLLALDAGRIESFALDEGFALRIDLRLEQSGETVVARLGRAFELRLTPDNAPEGRVTLTDPGPRPGLIAIARGTTPLPVGPWVTLELVHDGATLALRVDGFEVANALAQGAPFQQLDDKFEVSVAGAPVQGVVDEVQLLAFESSEPQALPFDVEISGLPRRLGFTPFGEAERAVEFTLKMLDEVSRWRIGPGGVLEPVVEQGADA